MKSLGRYTIRGSIPAAQEFTKVNLFDGSYSTAYKVHRLVVGMSQVDNTGGNSYALKLATESGLDPDRWNWNKNTEFGWAAQTWDANGIAGQAYSEVDPDNLIVEDLFIYCAQNATFPVNYMVIMEKFDVGLTKGVYNLVRNASQ